MEQETDRIHSSESQEPSSETHDVLTIDRVKKDLSLTRNSIRAKEREIAEKKDQKKLSERFDTFTSTQESIGIWPGDTSLTQKESGDLLRTGGQQDDHELQKLWTQRGVVEDRARGVLERQYRNNFDVGPLPPDRISEVAQESMKQYAELFGDKEETLNEKDIQFFSETYQDEYKKTLLDPEASKKNPEFAKIRDTILDRVMDGAASIDRADFPNDQAYQDALRKDIKDITGLDLSPEEAQKLLQNEKLADNLKKALAPLASSGGDPVEQKRWQQEMQKNIFFNKNEVGLSQNSGEVIGDHPEFSELKKQYDGIKEPDARIRNFHRAAGLNAGPGTPWCMSFAQYILRKHYGYQGPQTASARDGLRIGQPVTGTPQPGDLVLMPRNGGSGYHIAFVEKIEGNTVTYWGGNQSNSVCSKQCNSSGLQFRNITSIQSTGGGH